MARDSVAVEMRNIVKVYPDGTVALRGVDFVVREGEIHALLGENGAGKTTLMRILYGEIKPTKGVIKVFGKEVSFRNPLDAIRNGISMVYQHFSLIPTFTVFENLYLATSSLTKMSVSEVRKRVEAIAEALGLEVPLDAVVEDLPVGVQQRVEIVKALLLGTKILILDEPTSVLTPVEVKSFFKMLKELRSKGVTTVFITHKLREAKEIADRITILRRGRVVGVVDVNAVDEAELAKMMVGREVFLKIDKKLSEPGEAVLRVEDLWVEDDRGLEAVRGVSFELREGEIMGIVGVQGNGQKELAEAIVGLRPVKRGKIYLSNIDVTELKLTERYRLGLAYVPDSRLEALVHDMSVLENSILTNIRKFVKYRVIDLGNAKRYAEEVVKKFDVLTPSLFAKVRYLSGGNQQKLVVGREVSREPKVLIVCEPTHGLDIASTEYVRRLMVRLRDEGKSILLISTDLDEVLDLSDRIAVMYRGKVVAMGSPKEFTIEKLGLLMGGAVEVTE